MARTGGAPENLKKFVKNDPRINKAGRPKKLPHLDTLLANVLGEEKDGKTAAEAILMALRSKATRGDVRAAEVLLERAFGKVKQDLGIGNIDDKVITVELFSNGNKG